MPGPYGRRLTLLMHGSIRRQRITKKPSCLRWKMSKTLSSPTASVKRHKQLSEAETAADNAYRRTDALYRRGTKDYLSVLDSRHNKLAIEDEQAQAETALHISIVSLYRAFGGGWTG